MRRRTRKSLVHLALFGGILVFLLYVNRPQSSSKTFAWTRIRYQSKSGTLPPARGVCAGLATSAKPALVVSRVAADGDPSWLDALADSYHLCIYSADEATTTTTSGYLPVPANRGHEAMAYLTFLIDNYADFPAAGAVFVHGSRWAWHNDAPDYDNAALLAALNVSRALAPWGYHNMRCDWSASTCPPSTPPQGSLETSVQAALVPWDARAVSDAALPRALALLFGGHEKKASSGLLLGRTDAVRAQCCAQFVVARHRVWQHSRDEYVALRQWLLETAPRDDRIAGRILSYVWHILFMSQGESESATGVDLERLNSLACPRADECYCRLYGRCGLDRCTSPGSCYGQYQLPRDYKLPEDWAARHSEP
jgi:hypothetical protein